MSYVITGLIPTTGSLIGGAYQRSERAELIHNHLRLAEFLARKHSFGACEPADMRQVAYMALVKAADRFDPTRGIDFAAYAAPTIAGECKRYLRDHGWMVRPPRAVQDLQHNVAIESARLTQELGREPSTEDLADALDAPKSAVRESIAARSSMHPESLDYLDPTGERGPAPAMGMGHESDGFDKLETADAISRACDTLSPRDKRVLHLRFVEERTQAEIGEELGVTQMQVSRILRRIVGELRTTLQAC